MGSGSPCCLELDQLLSHCHFHKWECSSWRSAPGHTGIAGFVLIAILTAGILEAEVRVAGCSKFARQVEFLWVLSMAVKSGRSLADEIDAYAQGTWGSRHRKLVEMANRMREGVPLTEIVVPRGLLPSAALMPIHVGITSKSLEESLQSTKPASRFTRQLAEDQAAPHPGKLHSSIRRLSSRWCWAFWRS